MKHTATETVPRNYTDNWTPKYFYIPAMCMAVALITTNVLSFKIIGFFGTGFSGGTLMFPVCLILGDLTTEVYGFRRTRSIVFISVACYFIFMLFTQLAIYLPPASEWKNQEVFSQLFGQAPRIFVGSACAYISSELINAYIMSRMKVVHKGKYFSLRATISAVVAEFINTTIFVSIVWSGKITIPFMGGMIFAGSALKVVIQTIVLPITWALTRKLKALEGVDHFDTKI